MYSTATEALIAQRMSSPLDDQIVRTTRPRRQRLSTTFRPASNRGGQL